MALLKVITNLRTGKKYEIPRQLFYIYAGPALLSYIEHREPGSTQPGDILFREYISTLSGKISGEDRYFKVVEGYVSYYYQTILVPANNLEVCEAIAKWHS